MKKQLKNFVSSVVVVEWERRPSLVWEAEIHLNRCPYYHYFSKSFLPLLVFLFVASFALTSFVAFEVELEIAVVEEFVVVVASEHLQLVAYEKLILILLDFLSMILLALVAYDALLFYLKSEKYRMYRKGKHL